MAAGDTPAAPAALYRKYRPATFAELRGQEHISEPLSQALRNGRVHHAYLFSGPRGCGKTSSARILARSLNCEQGPTPEPCGTCASCVALAPSGPGSIDVIEIDAASHGGVDDARDLRERAFYAPVSSRFKIYIVDEAHMVTREGFNALLKLVEEPPPHLKFVFATTEPEKVIATIRSRTHHYSFRLMPPAILRGLLEDILGTEDVTYEPAVLPVVIRAGAGSARDSLSVLDQLLAGSGPEGLTYERAVALLGYTDDRLLDEVAEAFATGNGAAVFGAVDRVVEGGHDPRRFAADLLDRLRDLIILAAVPDAGQNGLLDVPADRLERMREQASAFGQAGLAQAAATINAGLVEMRGAASPRLQLELMCAQVLLPAGEAPPGTAVTGPQGVNVDALLGRVERLERLLDQAQAAPPDRAGLRAIAPAAAPAGREGGERPAGREGGERPAGRGPGERGPGASDPPSRSVPSAPSSAPASSPAGSPSTAGAAPAAPSRSGGTGSPGGVVDAGAVRARWAEILEAVKREHRVAWILLNDATVDGLQDGVLTLRFASEGQAKGFLGSGYDADLKGVLSAMLGITPQIRAISTAGDGGRGPGGAGAGDGAQGSGGTAGGPRTGGAGGGSRASAAASASSRPRQEGTAESRPRPGSTGGGPHALTASSGGPRAGGSADEAEWAEDDAVDVVGLAGMDLIQRELGGQVIGEISEP